MNNLLFIWVEGASDARFFDAVLKPFFLKAYRRVEIRTYANLKRVKFEQILLGLEAMNADFIVVADIDQEPCVTSKKRYVQARIKGIADAQIRVVIQEIESWYLAGLDQTDAEQLGLPALDKTDTITKEHLIALIPEAFDSKIDFMMELLKHFSAATAIQKNASFRYFVMKHNIEIATKENSATAERI